MLTMKVVKAVVKALGMRLSFDADTQEYRLALGNNNEASAYYTDSLDDVMGTAFMMRVRPTTLADDKAIEAAMLLFPAQFGLRAFPGDVFRVSKSSSYISEGKVVLYTEVRRGEIWQSFCKGSIFELLQEVK